MKGLVTNERGTPRRANPNHRAANHHWLVQELLLGLLEPLLSGVLLRVVVDIPFFCCTKNQHPGELFFLGWSKLKH